MKKLVRIVFALLITVCSFVLILGTGMANDEVSIIRMSHIGRPVQLYQRFDFEEKVMDKDSTYKLSVIFKTENLDISEIRHFGLRINFFTPFGAWFKEDDIDLSSISVSHFVEDGENAWSKKASDGSMIRHNLGNLFVVNLDGSDEWQELSFNFSVPENAGSMQVALYNHGESKGSTVYWAMPKLIDTNEPDANLFKNSEFTELNFIGDLLHWINGDDGIFLENRVVELPESDPFAYLEKWRGVRPRLLITEEDIVRLRGKLPGDPQYLEFTRTIARIADNASARPTTYRDDGGENLWQRTVGNTLAYIATAFVLSGEERYLNKAENWLLSICDYPTWYYTLGAGHLLYAASITYDWLYYDLREETREIVRDKLLREADRSLPERLYLQNHLWVAASGVGATGLALFDEADEAKDFIEVARYNFDKTMDALGPDGASHEGVGYWQYGVEYMLKFMYLARDLLDVDYFNHPWWQNTAYYQIYLSTPRNAWTETGLNPTIGSIVDFADTSRGNWYGPDYLMRALASEYGNGYAQWFADRTNEAGIDNPSASWLNMIWYDPEIEPKHVEELPTLRHFEDMEIVSARSDWSGAESLVVLKCGPAIGHYGTERFIYHIDMSRAEDIINPNNACHVHWDANSFVIFGNDEWLIRSAGYGRRPTQFQNSLLVDGAGQVNLLDQPRHSLHPRIKKAESTPELDHIVGDGAEAYGDILDKFERHLLFVKPDVLIVIDDIKVRNLDTESKFDLLFHTEHDAREQSDGSFLSAGDNAFLRIEGLTIEDVEISAGIQDFEARGIRRFAVRLETKGVKWQNAMAFSWSDKSDEPTRVYLEKNADEWSFYVNNIKVVFDWSTGIARIEND